MTEKVNPSPFRPAEAFKTAGASYYGSSNGSFIVDGGDPTELSKQDTSVDDTVLNAFAESHSSSSFDVTLDPGEGFVFGSWLVTDTSTTITLSSNTTTRVYVGWDKDSSDDVIIGPDDGRFANSGGDTDQKTPLYEFTTDGSGVTGVNDLRQVGPPLPPGEDIPNSSLENSSVTVANNTVDLGSSTDIDHFDLDSITSDDHHTKTTSASDLTDVSADSVADAHHSKYTDENAQDAVGYNLSSDFSYDDSIGEISLSSNTVTVAGNSVSLGGSTAIDHSNLNAISSDDHHAKGADAEDSGSLVVPDSTSFNFGANLDVSNDGDGTVTVSAQSSTDTRTHISENGSRVVNQTSDINFTDSGAASVNVSNDGDGSGTVNIDATNTNTTYSAGDGLFLLGTEFNVDAGGINHDNLFGISSGDHHSRYADSEAISAINNDSDHGSTASHNYTNRYTDEEAQDAVGSALNGTMSYNDFNDEIGVNRSNPFSWSGEHTFNSGMDLATDARIKFSDGIFFRSVDDGINLAGFNDQSHATQFFVDGTAAFNDHIQISSPDGTELTTLRANDSGGMEISFTGDDSANINIGGDGSSVWPEKLTVDDDIEAQKDITSKSFNVEDSSGFFVGSYGYNNSNDNLRITTGKDVVIAASDTTYLRVHSSGTTDTGDLDILGSLTENASL